MKTILSVISLSLDLHFPFMFFNNSFQVLQHLQSIDVFQ